MRSDAKRTGGLSILLVDDDDAVRESVGLLLTRLGHAVISVSSGEEAIRQLGEQAAADLVLLDLNMPVLGGAETFRRIEALRPNLPVVLMTGYEERAAALTVGDRKVRFLQKPFHLTELRMLLEEEAAAKDRCAAQNEPDR